MTDDQAFPPPAQPRPELPTYPVSDPPAPGPIPPPPPGAPIALGAAHKPGSVPLRPLNLGDIYDGAFRIIRFNPKATVGTAVLVSSVAMLIPVVISAVATFTVGATLSETGEIGAPGASDSEVVGSVVAFGSVIAGTLLLQVGLIFVTGMVAHVAAAAAIGKRLTLGEAWGATHGKRWKLLGLVSVMGIASILGFGLYVLSWVVVSVSGSVAFAVFWGVVTVPAFIAGMFWFWVRVYYLPPAVLMLEPVGVFEAIRRGIHLTKRQFWRIFGIALLTLLITSIAGGILSVPFTIAGELAFVAVPEYEVLGFAVTQAVSSILSSAFVAPFAAAVTSLLYIDQRIRKEAFDVELMARAGITSS